MSVALRVTYLRSLSISISAMKYLVAAVIFLAQASAFTFVSKHRAGTRLFAEYEAMEGEGKINLKVSDPLEGSRVALAAIL